LSLLLIRRVSVYEHPLSAYELKSELLIVKTENNFTKQMTEQSKRIAMFAKN